MTHPNEALIRDAFAAFGRGDVGAMRSQYLAEDVRWHFPGQHAFAGHHEGADRVIEVLGKLGELTGGTHSVEVHDVLADDDHVVVLHVTRAERAGKRLEVNTVLIFHIRDGKMTEFWTMHSDPYAVDEFWS